MKKKMIKRCIKRLLIMTSVLTLLIGNVVFASRPSSPNYCETCGKALNYNVTEVTRWTTTHQHYTGYTVGNQPVYYECTIYHTLIKESLSCPIGHGEKWSNQYQQERHEQIKY